jgi:hypothetical protein
MLALRSMKNCAISSREMSLTRVGTADGDDDDASHHIFPTPMRALTTATPASTPVTSFAWYAGVTITREGAEKSESTETARACGIEAEETAT